MRFCKICGKGMNKKYVKYCKVHKPRYKKKGIRCTKCGTTDKVLMFKRSKKCSNCATSKIGHVMYLISTLKPTEEMLKNYNSFLICQYDLSKNVNNIMVFK